MNQQPEVGTIIKQTIIKQVEYEFSKIGSRVCMDDKFFHGSTEGAKFIAEQLWDGLLNVAVVWPVGRRRLLRKKWPVTWWDAFKERWFPAWAKRRWPVRYETITAWELANIKREPIDKLHYRYFVEEGFELDQGGL